MDMAMYEQRVLDGRRGRKQPKRKCVDFNSTYLRHLHQRIFFRDYRDLPDVQPSLAFDKHLRPATACAENPASLVTTKLADTSVNKNNQHSHRCPVFAIAWTPEGRGLVAGNSQGEFTLWDGYEFNFLTIWQGHDQAVQAVTWSNYGDFMVSGDKVGLLKYWMNNMNEVKKFTGHKDAVRAISFSPSDLKFVTGADDTTLKLWDFETATEERKFEGHHWDVKCAAWHPSKPLVLSGGKDHKVKRWDPKSGKCLDTIHAHKNTVRGCAWLPNGNSFVTGGRDQKLKLFDLRRTSDALMTFNGHRAEITALAVLTLLALLVQKYKY